MKILITILTILMLTSCVDSKKSINEQTKIDLELVDNIHIKKELYGTDSIRLNKEQTELFVKEWNNAKPEGLYKMGPEFWLILELNNDSIRKFRTNRNLIKEKNDWTYSISDSTLISSFWKTYLANFVDSLKVEHSLIENPLILIDGVAIQYESMNEGWFLMKKEDISSLKYIKKGETRIYGSKDKFGVVSLTTRLSQIKKLESSPIHAIKRIYVIDGEIVTKEFVEKFDKSKIIGVAEISDKKSIAEFTSEDYDQLVYITTKIPIE
jgi:hypothetical protein